MPETTGEERDRPARSSLTSDPNETIDLSAKTIAEAIAADLELLIQRGPARREP